MFAVGQTMPIDPARPLSLPITRKLPFRFRPSSTVPDNGASGSLSVVRCCAQIGSSEGLSGPLTDIAQPTRMTQSGRQRSEYFSRIHDATWIKGRFDGPHCGYRGRPIFDIQEPLLSLPNRVLAGARSVH